MAQQTVIPFEVAQAGHVELMVYDALGTLLHNQEMEATAGYNVFTVQGQQVDGAGLLIYTIKTTTTQATNRMLIVRE